MPRPLLKKQIEYAQTQTKSHWAAAKFLNVGYTRYKKYAIAYGLFFNDHLNPGGRGIRKPKMSGAIQARPLQDIFDGKFPNYNRKKLLRRLVRSGLLEQKCSYCGINYSRPNGRGPYDLDYKDSIADNLAFENLQIICFNCRFLTKGTFSLPEEMIPVTYQDRDLTEANEIDESEILKLRDELQSKQFEEDTLDDFNL